MLTFDSKSTIFVVDIDGTVCDSLPRIKQICGSHGLILDSPVSRIDELWTDELVEELFSDEEVVICDPVISGAYEVIEKILLNNNPLVFLTGREEIHREVTRTWLSFKLNVDASIPLLMKPNGENRGHATLYKEHTFRAEILSRNASNSYIFFDDDLNTVKMYSRYGLALKSPECWDVFGDNL